MGVVLKRKIKGKTKNKKCFVYNEDTGEVIEGKIKDGYAIVEVPYFSNYRKRNIRVKDKNETIEKKKSAYKKDGEQVTVEMEEEEETEDKEKSQEELLKRAQELGVPANPKWKKETLKKHIAKAEKEAE